MNLIINNLPILHVLIPMIAAPLCIILTSPRAVSILTISAVTCSFIVSLMSCMTISRKGIIEYAFGGWQPPIGIEYQIDPLGAPFMLLISFIALCCVMYAKLSISPEIERKDEHLYYGIFLILLSGFLGIVSTNDIFNIYVFLEISSIASYALIARGSRGAPFSAFNYLVVGSIGACLILISIGLIYLSTGSLNISDISSILRTVEQRTTIDLACVIFFVGCLLKLGVAPMHMWMVNYYRTAPNFVSSFLAGTSSKVIIYILIRYVYSLFNSECFNYNHSVEKIIFLLISFSILFGAYCAIKSNNFKAMLAYSSISNIGYMLLALFTVSASGLSAAIALSIQHSLTKCALMMSAGILVNRLGAHKIEDLSGCASHNPLLFIILLFCSLNIMSIPFTAGFIGKLMLLSSVIESEHWLCAAVVAISSFLSFLYIWRVVEYAYFSKKERYALEDISSVHLFAPFILAFIVIYMGIDTSMLVGLSTEAAEFIFNN